MLEDDELNWKMSFDYLAETNAILLEVNGVLFQAMPFQLKANKEGPQNITKGTIMLDGDKVHEGFVQYTDDTFDEWHSELEYEPITDVSIEMFECTSSEVLNSVIDDIGRAVDEEQGLKSLSIEFFLDENELEEWPLG